MTYGEAMKLKIGDKVKITGDNETYFVTDVYRPDTTRRFFIDVTDKDGIANIRLVHTQIKLSK